MINVSAYFKEGVDCEGQGATVKEAMQDLKDSIVAWCLRMNEPANWLDKIAFLAEDDSSEWELTAPFLEAFNRELAALTEVEDEPDAMLLAKQAAGF